MNIKKEILEFAKKDETERNKEIDTLLDNIAKHVSYCAKNCIEDCYREDCELFDDALLFAWVEEALEAYIREGLAEG
jgi:hypothetical protein